jgi:hypothetical protein
MKKLLVVLLVLGLAAPAMAADWHFYGSLRTHLGYYNVDEDFLGGPAMDGSIGTPGDDDGGTLLSLSGQSRFGAKVIASDSLTALVEFGLREASRKTTTAPNSDEAVYLRALLGTWNFGAGKLLVGKFYTPGTFLGYSGMHGDLGDQGDANMLLGGLAYIGRQPMIQLQFGTFEFALIEPNTDASVFGAAGAGYTDKDFVLPRIEAAYVFRTPVIAIRPVAGFQTFKLENPTTGDDETVTSYMGGLGVSLTLGPAYVKATASYLQNPAAYGQGNAGMVSTNLNGAGNSILSSQFIGTDVEDSDLLQGTFVVGMKINDMLGVEAGFGYADAEVDVAAGKAEQTSMLYYLQVPIMVAKGVSIIPEIGMLDRDDVEIAGVETDQGKMTYVDVNFRIDF